VVTRQTVPFLNSFGTVATPQIYVGCAKWGRKDWVGKIYPEGIKESDFLKLYGKHFNSIELNATSTACRHRGKPPN